MRPSGFNLKFCRQDFPDNKSPRKPGLKSFEATRRQAKKESKDLPEVTGLNPRRRTEVQWRESKFGGDYGFPFFIFPINMLKYKDKIIKIKINSIYINIFKNLI